MRKNEFGLPEGELPISPSPGAPLIQFFKPEEIQKEKIRREQQNEKDNAAAAKSLQGICADPKTF
jgi:hypothetical protein